MDYKRRSLYGFLAKAQADCALRFSGLRPEV